MGAIHTVLAEIARAAISNPPQRRELHGRAATMVLNGAYLVDRDRAAEFGAAVDALAAHWAPRGLEFQLTGPWPPYNFTSATEEVPA